MTHNAQPTSHETLDIPSQFSYLQLFETVSCKSSGRRTLASIAATTMSLLIWMSIATLEGEITWALGLLGLINLGTVILTLLLIRNQIRLHRDFLAIIQKYPPANREAYEHLLNEAKPSSLFFWRYSEAWIAEERRTLQQRRNQR